MDTLAGLLGYIDSQVSPAKRKLADLLRNPVDSMNQRMGLLNDRARDWNKISDLSGDAMDLRMRGSVMADLPQYKQAEQQQLSGLLNVLPIGQTVYHGSPHKFDKFDSSKIGTGEGKQQQGIGAYLADVQDVGQRYADNEAAKRGMSSGYLYKVEIPDPVIASMAKREAPMSQQPQTVQNAINELMDADSKKALNDYHGWTNLQEAPFAAVMDAMEIANGNNRAAVSEVLRKAGVPGLSYLDRGSRGAGSGTNNYVVFPGNEGLLKILERNGQALK